VDDGGFLNSIGGGSPKRQEGVGWDPIYGTQSAFYFFKVPLDFGKITEDLLDSSDLGFW